MRTRAESEHIPTSQEHGVAPRGRMEWEGSRRHDASRAGQTSISIGQHRTRSRPSLERQADMTSPVDVHLRTSATRTTAPPSPPASPPTPSSPRRRLRVFLRIRPRRRNEDVRTRVRRQQLVRAQFPTRSRQYNHIQKSIKTRLTIRPQLHRPSARPRSPLRAQPQCGPKASRSPRRRS